MAERPKPTGDPADFSPPREKVLIIEDDPGVARLEQIRLTRAGFEVELARTALAGMEVVLRGGIDLIILDQDLPGGLSGLDFYEKLRSSGDQTPAILVTGLSDEATLIRAVRGGLSDFVLKTIDYLDDLTRAVERVIAQIRTRRRLAESEERLAGVTLLAQAIPQIVWTARVDGDLDFTNDRWFEYSGLTLKETEGWNWSQSLHPDDLERVSDQWKTSLATGNIFETEYRLRRASDGSYRWFLVRGQLINDPDARIVKWFGTCTDIDDQKRHEQELKRANELAEVASRAKDQFLAMLSHELRTPLTPVLLTAAAFRDDPETPEHLRRTFDEICQSLELEARLIDDLLDVMRIIRGKMPYHFQVVDAHPLIGRAIEICRSEANERDLRLIVELDAQHHHVNADAARLQQVLWNLIKNAVKFTPSGGQVTISSRDVDQTLRIDVVDSGIGINPVHLSTIFNAFEQGEDQITQRFGGLGLGLAISRSIAEGHHGTLTASSEGRHQGATFTLILPAVAPSTSDDPAPSPGRSLENRVEPTDRRILLVEDDVMTSRVMAKLLRQNGYLVTTANSVAGALEVPYEAYNLVVSDIGLPDGSGLELIQKIRRHHDVPGIALTGYGMEADIQKSQEAGFAAHLTKPLNFEKLDNLIRQVVNQNQGRPIESPVKAFP